MEKRGDDRLRARPLPIEASAAQKRPCGTHTHLHAL